MSHAFKTPAGSTVYVTSYRGVLPVSEWRRLTSVLGLVEAFSTVRNAGLTVAGWVR